MSPGQWGGALGTIVGSARADEDWMRVEWQENHTPGTGQAKVIDSIPMPLSRAASG